METAHIMNGTEILITREANIARVTIAGRTFTQPASLTDERLAEIAFQVANPKPSPERIEAQRLADSRDEIVCDHCGGLGGWRGWPGFTCHKCDGHRTVAA